MFQRTPNYVMPGRNHLLSDEQRTELRHNFEGVWRKTFDHVFAFPMEPANRLGSDFDDAELERVLEAGWEASGFHFVFETFDDMFVDQRVNDRAAEFVRRKIRAIVNDPETAELLCPQAHPIGGKRPPLGTFYYETFNRPNVKLISVKDDPIQEITPAGLRTGTAEHEFDVIIFATGFDAITGPLAKMNVHGTGGRTIAGEWKEGAKVLLGVSTPGFPNLFSILGPQAPFASHPPVIEAQVDFIGQVLARAQADGIERAEATAEAAQAWSDQCDAVLDATILHQGEGRPWFLGENVPGKRPGTLCYLGGMGNYVAEVNKQVEDGFPGYVLTGSRVPA
ncbi:hypothetical protein GCM10022222_00550 [Amycolatopsis ultiminotia]|uniref:Cyclohexanone monooxygenase n=1 Tax=Amycolatopsis ultiminotia TaxID=543629 RepID=A0ABP6UWV3_9PSEU